MRIGIWYHPALAQGGGIGRYTRGLVAALLARPEASAHRIVLVCGSDAPRGAAVPAGATLRRLPLSEPWLNRLWHRLRLPLAVDRWLGGLDLFHSPDFLLPPLARAAGLVTVHDLSFLTYPEGAFPPLRTFLTKAVPRSVARARRVMADSASTRADLVALLGVDEGRVDVVGAGVSGDFRPLDPARREPERGRLGLPGRFILGVGTLEPRKNFTGLIRAFERLAPGQPDLHLVIAGGRGWLEGPILEAARTSAVAPRIHLPGFVADADLPALYSLADAFAFPTHYEGFGIPVLEAMACGTPVVCADNSSLPEVAGDAALLVKAGDDAALAAALGRLLDDAGLGDRLRAAGLERAKAFTWDAAAGRLWGAYGRAMEGGVMGRTNGASE